MYDENEWGLTDDEKKAGVGDLLNSRGPRPGYNKNKKKRSDYPKKWSSSDHKLMIELFKQGKTVEEIARVLGRSNIAIGMRLRNNDFIDESAVSSNYASNFYKTGRVKERIKNIKYNPGKILKIQAQDEKKKQLEIEDKYAKKRKDFLSNLLSFLIVIIFLAVAAVL